MTTRPPVVVVFATLQHAATLPALLDALDQTTWPGLGVIAIDCGSTDGSRELLQQRAARGDRSFRWLDGRGLGRASALAMAMAEAPGADIVRLHADVVPDDPDWLERLFRVLQQYPACGIVGGKIVFAGGRVQSCGRDLITGLGIVEGFSDRRHLENDRDDVAAAAEVDGVGGHLCWIRRAVLDATGGLDRGYDPVGGDDDDLCLAARWHGFTVMVEPAVRGVHHSPRPTHLLATGVQEPSGLLDHALAARRQLAAGHHDYFHQKWGFDPKAPDLHEVRRRYGHTRICWRIGERLTERLPAQPAVDVCVVTWNSRAVLPRMLDHLARTRWPELRLFVVDNGSSDGTVGWLQERAATLPFPLQVESLPQNVGIAQAMNLAFAKGTAPIVARLDDDAFVPPDWLERMVPRFHQRPYAGMVGPRISNDHDGSLQCGPGRLWPAPLAHVAPGEGDRLRGLARVVTVRGCCNLYRRSVLATVGGLDIRFSPSQFDELDHHLALAVAGYEVLYDGEVEVGHRLVAGRQSTAAGHGNFRGNRTKVLAKWGGDPWPALERAIDLSIDGRLLPADGDTSRMRAALPSLPPGPPTPRPRDPAELALYHELARSSRTVLARGGPLDAWWQHVVAIAEQALADADPLLNAVASQLQELRPDEPQALMTVARFHAYDGNPELAARVARWALRLAPHDARLRAAAEALTTPAATFTPFAAAPASARRPAPTRVLLLPPLRPDHGPIDDAVADTYAALAAVGVPARIERDLVPTLAGVEVVHAFGLGDATTLLPRLQAVRATAPHVRIVLSSLSPDPGPANWLGAWLANVMFAPAATLRRHFAAAANGSLQVPGANGRHLPGDGSPVARDYERRCLDFVDRLLVHHPHEAAWLARRWPERQPQLLELGCAEATTGPAGRHRARVPYGGAISLGARDVPGHHAAMVLALAGSDVPLSLCGQPAFPFAEAHLRRSAPGGVHWLPAMAGAERAAALRQSAVLLWLPAAPTSFSLPVRAALCGAGLVLARGVGAEALFGDHACYVDPCDLDALRHAVLAARAAWQPEAPAPWRRDLAAVWSLRAAGERLLANYGLASRAAPSPRAHHHDLRTAPV
ncbi:MAG: glycosyltransferase family 2 protein [Planctomycetes bacterium]|nr:glycosyltransferase family 2 protein [Planctomycetota bacterium]